MKLRLPHLTLNVQTVLLVLIVVLSAFVRLYRFEDFLQFLDDQGRDAIVIKRILVNGDLTLLGPGTSVGSMYLGPLYYYLAVPFLALTYPSPVGPALAVAFLSILTTALIYVLGKEMVGRTAAMLAMALYAFAPAAILLGRFSWQPNPAPFFGLVMLWASYCGYKKNLRYWMLAALCFAVLTHLHYVALLAAAPAAAVFGYQVYRRRAEKGFLATAVRVAGVSLGILVLSASPLIAFNLRHDNLILKGFQEFFRSSGSPIPLLERLWLLVRDAHGRGMHVAIEFFGFSKEIRGINTVLLALFAVSAAVLAKKSWKKSKDLAGVMFPLLWVGLAIVGLSAYRNVVYDHYLGFIFPAVSLAAGSVLTAITQRGKIFTVAVALFVIILSAVNVRSLDFGKERPQGIQDVREVVRDILPVIPQNKRFNIALLNDNREYKGNKYRYFFEVSNKPLQSQYEYQDLDGLIIIVENGEDPHKSPIYEIQEFFQEAKSPKLVTERTYRGIVRVYVYERE